MLDIGVERTGRGDGSVWVGVGVGVGRCELLPWLVIPLAALMRREVIFHGWCLPVDCCSMGGQ